MEAFKDSGSHVTGGKKIGNIKIAVYSFEKFDNLYLGPSLCGAVGESSVKKLPLRLCSQSADLAAGCEAVCIFVNDQADAACIKILGSLGVKILLLRSTGFNHVDLEAAFLAGITVRRVPAYSPYAVAEMAVGLLLSVVRKIPRAYARVREHNFSINGLEGFDIHGKTIGIVGTGKIGLITAQILNGFSPGKILAYDVYENEEAKKMGCVYKPLDTVFNESDIISLHLPLLPETYHIINKESLVKMKKGVVIINVSRGALVDTIAVEDGLKSGRIGGLGMDVYENEQSYFFSDCSDQVISDDVLTSLLTFPNVVVTAHQAFLTKEALEQISSTTIQNLQDSLNGVESRNECKLGDK